MGFEFRLTGRRIVGATALVVLTALVASLPQVEGTRATAAQCTPKSLGVSRTIEIDATGGPRYGHQQYKDHDFLADGEVVLTFDDGPSSIYTPRVLKALDEHCTKATFFMVGSRAIAEHELVKDIERRGHTIGTHTWSHANVRAVGAVARQGRDRDGHQRRAARCRPADRTVLPLSLPRRQPRACRRTSSRATSAMFSIDVDAYDYKTLNPAEVHRTIISQLTAKKKGIILFHDIQPATAGALSGLLAELKTRGFRVVHMVPAAPGTTQEQYDVIAGRDANRRQVAVAANPLARRAVTWPVSSVQPAAVTAPQPLPVGIGAALPTPGQPTPAIGAPMAAQPLPRRVDEDDWRKKVFGN